MAEVSDILRAFVGDASHVIFVDEHDGGVVVARSGKLLDIDYSSVGDAASTFKPGAALAFKVVSGFRFPTQKPVGPE